MARTEMVQPDGPESERVFGRLRLFNAAMGCLHLVQGVAMLLLSNAYTLPLRQTFLSGNPTASEISTKTTTLFDIRLGPMVAAFLFISAIAHFLVASPWLYPWYVREPEATHQLRALVRVRAELVGDDRGDRAALRTCSTCRRWCCYSS